MRACTSELEIGRKRERVCVRVRVMHQVYSCCERERERELSIRASKLVAQQLFSDLPIVFSGPLRRVAGLWASKKTSLAAARPAARGCLVAVCQAQKKYCQSSTVFVRSWCIIYIIAQCLYYRIHFRICELGGKNVGIEQIWLKWLHGVGGGAVTRSRVQPSRWKKTE